MPISFDDHPFWDFSLAVYGTSGVSEACIDLQERHGLDVNLLLFCTWIGASGRGVLGPAEIDAAVAAVQGWNAQVVCGLRSVRRWMKEARTGIDLALSDALRRQIIGIEVNCEHAEQLALAGAVPREPGAELPLAAERAVHCAANIAGYLRRLGVRAGADDLEPLARILNAALPEAGGTAVAEALRSLPSG